MECSHAMDMAIYTKDGKVFEAALESVNALVFQRVTNATIC